MTEFFNPAAIAKALRGQDAVEVKTIKATPGDQTTAFAVVPDGKKIESLKPLLDEYLTKPRRRKGTAVAASLESFIELSNRFKAPNSLIFGSVEGVKHAQLKTVFNYHPEGPNNTDTAFGDHQCIYDFPFSEEWKTWNDQHLTPMNTAEFAQFVENNIVDIAYFNEDRRAGLKENNPTIDLFLDRIKGDIANPTRLMELSRGLSVNEGHQVKNHQNLQSGEAKIMFEVEHSDDTGQALNVPPFFIIEIPVFQNSGHELLLARLRYRVRNGTITWFYDLVRPDLIVNQAIEADFIKAAKETELLVLRGKP